MIPQRVRGAENRTENSSSNGPLRVQSKDILFIRVFCNERTSVSCQEYVGTLQSAWVIPMNQGGTTDRLNFIRP